jgi:hypothetical protein
MPAKPFPMLAMAVSRILRKSLRTAIVNHLHSIHWLHVCAVVKSWIGVT